MSLKSAYITFYTSKLCVFVLVFLSLFTGGLHVWRHGLLAGCLVALGYLAVAGLTWPLVVWLVNW